MAGKPARGRGPLRCDREEGPHLAALCLRPTLRDHLGAGEGRREVAHRLLGLRGPGRGAHTGDVRPALGSRARPRPAAPRPGGGQGEGVIDEGRRGGPKAAGGGRLTSRQPDLVAARSAGSPSDPRGTELAPFVAAEPLPFVAAEPSPLVAAWPKRAGIRGAPTASRASRSSKAPAPSSRAS